MIGESWIPSDISESAVHELISEIRCFLERTSDPVGVFLPTYISAHILILQGGQSYQLVQMPTVDDSETARALETRLREYARQEVEWGQ